MQQIIKNEQDGLYYIYCGIKNEFLLEKATKEEIIQYHINKAVENVESILSKEDPYGYLSLTYQEACEVIKNNNNKVRFC